MKRAKITVVGAGNVGATCAQLIARDELGDVVLVDIPDKADYAKGKALDLAQWAAADRFDAELTGTSDYADSADSDVVVITAGIPRKPGMSRDDLIQTNVKIVASVSEQVAKTSPNAVVIVVSNPLDAMVYTAYKVTGFAAERVMGQAGCLDVARYCCFIAAELGCSVEDISALLLGGHGDDMVPLPRYTSVSGIPVNQLIAADKLDAIVARTRGGGGEIVKLMGTSAYYAPAAGTVQMVEAVVRDKRRILPCAAYCDSQYRVGGYFVGVPAVLGDGGVRKIIEIDLNAEEKAMFDESASHVKELCGIVDKLL